jgi:hypothetical protein
MSTTRANDPKTSNHDVTNSILVSDSITQQFDKLKQLFFVNDTAKTFEKSLHLFFVLTKESMILIWLALCWVIVAVSWVSAHSTQIVHGVKGWWSAFHEVDPHKSKMDIAIETIQNTMQSLVLQAKKQVGLQDNQ